MTTTVRVLIECDKTCEIKVIEPDGSISATYTPRELRPQEFTEVYIYGEQAVSIKEAGNF